MKFACRTIAALVVAKVVLVVDMLSLANHHPFAEISWSHFWAVQIWLLVNFLMFCTLRELARVMGSEQVRLIFFGPSRSGAG